MNAGNVPDILPLRKRYVSFWGGRGRIHAKMSEHDANQKEYRLNTPREWIERRMEQASHGLSRSAIDRLKLERNSPLSANSVQLSGPLNISHFPDAIEQIAQKAGIPVDDMLSSIRRDFEEGIAVQETPWNRAKFSVSGSRWRVVLRLKRGERTGCSLAVLESAQNVFIPSGQTTFRPTSVGFHPVWDEKGCELENLVANYRTCKRSFEDAERELRRGETDPAIRTRAEIHASVRRQYSALRVMMDLLQARSDQERESFAAIVLREGALSDSPPQDKSIGSLQSQDGEGAETSSLRLQLQDRLPANVLEEDTLIELRHSNRLLSRRARVLSVSMTDGKPVVEIDLASGTLRGGENVAIHTVSRFGMWAHQRAIHDFLDERVEGNWCHLAQLLSLPAKLEAGERDSAPARYFCDADNGGPSLNERQRMAVAGALATPHAFCIQGPPGTGKTTVICELVQQLIARGERILLVAPTHVAVDEVLRRIGSRPMVRALRLSWDDARVAEDVRKFTPTNIIEPFIERVQNPDESKTVPWQQERESVGEALATLLALQELQQQRIVLQGRRQSADRALNDSRRTLAAERPGIEGRLDQLERQLQTATAEINKPQGELRDAETAFRAISAKANWLGKALGFLGFGEVGKTRRQRSRRAKQLRKQESVRDELLRNKQAAANRLDGLQASVADAESNADIAGTLLTEAVQKEKAATERCGRHEMLRDQMLSADIVATLLAELRARDNRLDGYQRLAARFDTLVAQVREEGEDLEGLRRDLLGVTNLFCCTTTGVASNPTLKELVFDTLIVDEASRVTDAEFLIGATRARRWILVGDEHQLPPYVEQNDEHFIHALSALHQSEFTGKQLDAAVEELGLLWEEDEELHQFRRTSVLAVAERIRDSGHWDSNYRDAFQKGVNYLRNEVDDPSRALLRAMRANLIHSLFERVAGSCPAAMRVRLVKQRRMIEPLASIVSEPVYGGDYQTPSSEELARCGVVALTTPSFPTPITFLDTSLHRNAARDEMRGNSFTNPFEADWIVQACKVLDRELSQAGSRPVTVSILSFYKAQARMIDDRLKEIGKNRFRRLRFSVIDAIDGIQGQESDVVILSFCRTAGKTVGPGFGQWLQDLRRLNVACTRAHRALIFVGQKELLGKLCSNEQAAKFYRHFNELFDRRPDVMRVVRQFGNRSA
jgi:hypothetical protein